MQTAREGVGQRWHSPLLLPHNKQEVYVKPQRPNAGRGEWVGKRKAPWTLPIQTLIREPSSDTGEDFPAIPRILFAVGSLWTCEQPPEATWRSQQRSVPRLLPSLPCPTSAEVSLFTTTAQPKTWKHCRDRTALYVPTSTLHCSHPVVEQVALCSQAHFKEAEVGKGIEIRPLFLQAKISFLKHKNWCQVHLHCPLNHNYAKCFHILQTFSVKRQEHMFLNFPILPEKTHMSLSPFSTNAHLNLLHRYIMLQRKALLSPFVHLRNPSTILQWVQICSKKCMKNPK